MELRRAIGARQAHYAVWDGGDYPLSLKESFGEAYLSREIARPGILLEKIPDGVSMEVIFNRLAHYEDWMTWAEQQAWIREQYPDEFLEEA